jgi:DNA-binding MarR family transcriptional regulator
LQSEPLLSRPSRQQLVEWRAFLECAYALMDILDEEMQVECGLSIRWYDVLLHLEEADGLQMNEIAERILFSKSGLTRLIDRMEDEGLVRRERPANDRRVIRVLITPKGLETLHAAREAHHHGIQRHYIDPLNQRDLAAMAGPLGKLQRHLRPLRPGRIA